MPRLVFVWALVMGAGCGGSDELPCVTVDEQCAPLYEPTFDQVFERTLVPSCGVAGGPCHGADGAAGGLVFADVDEAYEALTGGTAPSVIAGDPSCSVLTRRIGATNDQVMPPGSPLSATERCSVEKWIASGAMR